MNKLLMQRRQRQQREDRQGVMIMAGCAGVLALTFGALVMNKPVEREASNGCPKGSRAPLQHVAVIDRTEGWSDTDKSVLREALFNLTAKSKLDERVTIVAFDGGIDGVVVFDRCRPLQGKDVNAAVSTPSRVDKTFRITFADPLKATLQEVTKKAEAKELHLAAFLSSLAASLSYRDEAESITVHVFSDMGEHTTAGSLLGSKKKAMEARTFTRYLADVAKGRLKNVRLHVHVVATPSTSGEVAKRIEQAWTAALEAAGVDHTWGTL